MRSRSVHARWWWAGLTLLTLSGCALMPTVRHPHPFPGVEIEQAAAMPPARGKVGSPLPTPTPIASPFQPSQKTGDRPDTQGPVTVPPSSPMPAPARVPVPESESAAQSWLSRWWKAPRRGRSGLSAREIKDAEATAMKTHCMQLNQQAQAAMDRKAWLEALGYLRQIAQDEPKSPEAHQRLGRALLELGRFAEAQAAFRKALELDRDYADALVGLGQTEFTLGRPRSALRYLDNAIEIDPKPAEAHLARGESLAALGQTDDALAAYFRALEREPTCMVATVRIAAIQRGRGQGSQALARLNQVLEIDAEHGEARYQRGLVYLDREQMRAAVSDLEFAARKLPSRPDVYYHLALALQSAEEPVKAMDAVEHALRLAPHYAEAQQLSDRLRR